MNKNERRSRRTNVDISVMILRIAEQEVNKTCLLQKANLNYAQLMQYVDVLVEKELLTELNSQDKARTRYKTTGKGIEFLTAIGKYYGGKS